ncbi:MAG TPA: FAD-linked oxidase C-terminal domain-containing protein [Burkholderiales bacterium]|nr:FAD-linked oxidase C-terminal domain-containing protein [Burkholderiales bacterium]
MNAPAAPISVDPARHSHRVLARRLRREVDGVVLFDAFSRGRYSTDASIYQIEPVGVVVPRTEEAARIALQIAAEEGVPILPRGAGTSQCGQSVGAALVVDCSRSLNAVIEFDAGRREVTVQPGMVLDQLNAFLRPHQLWFPVDVSTSAQATIGGMTGNNSCGSRSIRYGNMVHNVLGVDAWLSGGDEFHFGPSDALADAAPGYRALVAKIHAIARREADEIEARWPKVLRRVQGYNLDMVLPGSESKPASHNLAHLLVGSEGTLAFSKRVTLKVSPIPAHKVLGVVHFAGFYQAMNLTRHIVTLDPDAVELVDRTMIDLARSNAAFRPIVARFLKSEPEAILLVEFAGEDRNAQVAKLQRLAQMMGDLGHPGAVAEITDAALQKEIWEVRRAGLNIMMSMKGDGKPVSFIEDCAVPLEHLAEYTERLTKIFAKHGTHGTWYAHASVGTLHVRPILDMRRDGAEKMRAIAEEACAMVREFKGAYSGEHGDGLVRSEWIEPILGRRLGAALMQIKDLFDPKGLMNPGKIVRPARMDDRSLFRYKPGYRVQRLNTALDWSDWGGFGPAVEMCNNNGHCRKFDAGTMCPSFRVTRDEQHLTRGRANTLRLAISGQLGPDALASDAMRETMALCVSCKGCKRECPTGVDMARMKIEFLHHYNKRHGLTLRQRLIAWLPRYAPFASRFAPLLNLRDAIPGLPLLTEKLFGLSARRSLPKWRSGLSFTPSPPTSPRPSPARGEGEKFKGAEVGEVVLLVDTFNRYFEPENVRAALDVLHAAGYKVEIAAGRDGGRPLCCGRTFLAAGLVDEAKVEAQRMLDALRPFVDRGVPIVGLEPSCLLTLRDEFLVMGLDGEIGPTAERALLFEEFLCDEADAGRLKLALAPLRSQTALLHGHCHQKAFDAMPAVRRVLGMIPGLNVQTVDSGCCGMAGSFGYEAEHFSVSMKMAEQSLLPAVRKAGPDTIVVADGTSCRHQIYDGARRKALHVARVLQMSVEEKKR